MYWYKKGYELSLNPFEDAEIDWNNGEHSTRDGKVILIREMETPHLVNTIRYFGKRGADVSALQNELNFRCL